MPIYEFICPECDHREELLRPVQDRNQPTVCSRCASASERVLSAPALSIWDAARSFPIAPVGDGYTFPSRAAYEKHLKDNDIAELSTDAPAKTNRGVTWSKTYGRQA